MRTMFRSPVDPSQIFERSNLLVTTSPKFHFPKSPAPYSWEEANYSGELSLAALEADFTASSKKLDDTGTRHPSLCANFPSATLGDIFHHPPSQPGAPALQLCKIFSAYYLRRRIPHNEIQAPYPDGETLIVRLSSLFVYIKCINSISTNQHSCLHPVVIPIILLIIIIPSFLAFLAFV